MIQRNATGVIDSYGLSELKAKAVPLHAMEALGGRGSIAPTHSRPRNEMGVSGQRHVPTVLYPR
jgi:hypothetical protein